MEITMKKREIMGALAVMLMSCGTARSDELKKEEGPAVAQPCAKLMEGVHCLSLLAAPQGLPETVEMEAVRSYAERLLTLHGSMETATHRVLALKKLSWPAAAQRYLERTVQASHGLTQDIEKTLESFQNFQDLQYHASRSSLGASRAANFLAEMRLYIPADENYEMVLEELEVQMKSFDEFSQLLMPDWLK
jgi:hypothetical protein